MKMKGKISLSQAFAVSLLIALSPAVQSEPENFSRTETLADWYTLSWSVDFAEKIVTYEVRAQTTGYVGFGINEIAGMKGADIVIGGVYEDGTSYFADRHGEGTFEPAVDESQDWKLLDASEANGWTTLKFSRFFFPCDEENDVQLSNSTFRVIYSVGATDNIGYHRDQRGTKSIVLLSPPMPPKDLTGLEEWNVTVNTTLPNLDTVYWITVHKSPTFGKKKHIVGFEAKVKGPEAEKYTHHMILYRCITEDPVVKAKLEELVGHPGYYFMSPHLKDIRPHCGIIFYVWGKGGTPLFLPDHVGLPVGESSTEEIVLLEVHYDNPSIDQDVQYETGVKIYYTENLRENDAAFLLAGRTIIPSQIVPPNVTDFVHVAHCSSECTREGIKPGGINVFSVFLHAHLNGRRIKGRQFRDGVELPWIVYDANYDFDFQQDRPLAEEIQIMPGDDLIVECSYDTTWQNPPRATFGGESMQHEMCEMYLMYYPASQGFEGCLTHYDPPEAIYGALGIEALDMTDFTYPVVTAPESMRGPLFEVLSSKVNWTPERIQKLQNQMRWEGQSGYCEKTTVPTPTYYPNATEYVPKFTCQN